MFFRSKSAEPARYAVLGDNILRHAHVDRLDEGTINLFVGKLRQDVHAEKHNFPAANKVVQDSAWRYLSITAPIVTKPLGYFMNSHLNSRFKQLQQLQPPPSPISSKTSDVEKMDALRRIVEDEDRGIKSILDESKKKSLSGTAETEAPQEDFLTVKAIELKLQHAQFEKINNDRPLASIRHANNDHNSRMAGHMADGAPALVEAAKRECAAVLLAAKCLPTVAVKKVAQGVARSVFTEQNEALAKEHAARLDQSRSPLPHARQYQEAMQKTDHALQQIRGDAAELAVLVVAGKEDDVKPESNWYKQFSAHLSDFNAAAEHEDKAGLLLD